MQRRCPRFPEPSRKFALRLDALWFASLSQAFASLVRNGASISHHEFWIDAPTRVARNSCPDAAPAFGAAQIPCDFTGNGKCNLEDIHELADAIALGQTSADINEDGNANSEDMEFYLTNALNRLNGDFDLIGGVDFSDFLRLSNNFGQAGQWSDGDANADGVIQFP